MFHLWQTHNIYQKLFLWCVKQTVIHQQLNIYFHICKCWIKFIVPVKRGYALTHVIKLAIAERRNDYLHSTRKVRSEANLHVCGVHHKGFALANCYCAASLMCCVWFACSPAYMYLLHRHRMHAPCEEKCMQSAENNLRSAACAAGLAIMAMLMHVMCTLKYGRRSYNRHLITASFYIY
jgi:hypothetical protein